MGTPTNNNIEFCNASIHGSIYFHGKFTVNFVGQESSNRNEEKESIIEILNIQVGNQIWR